MLKKIALIILLASSATLASYAVTRNPHQPNQSTIDGKQLFTNTKYKYRLWYPSSADIIKAGEMEPGGVEVSNNISIGIPGAATLLHVIAWATTSPGLTSTDSLNLKDFAERVHGWQIDDNNSYDREKTVSSPERIHFKETEAYRFRLTESFTKGYYVGPRIHAVQGLPEGLHEIILFRHRGVNFTLIHPLYEESSWNVIDSFELF